MKRERSGEENEPRPGEAETREIETVCVRGLVNVGNLECENGTVDNCDWQLPHFKSKLSSRS